MRGFTVLNSCLHTTVVVSGTMRPGVDVILAAQLPLSDIVMYFFKPQTSWDAIKKASVGRTCTIHYKQNVLNRIVQAYYDFLCGVFSKCKKIPRSNVLEWSMFNLRSFTESVKHTAVLSCQTYDKNLTKFNKGCLGRAFGISWASLLQYIASQQKHKTRITTISASCPADQRSEFQNISNQTAPVVIKNLSMPLWQT